MSIPSFCGKICQTFSYQTKKKLFVEEDHPDTECWCELVVLLSSYKLQACFEIFSLHYVSEIAFWWGGRMKFPTNAFLTEKNVWIEIFAIVENSPANNSCVKKENNTLWNIILKMLKELHSVLFFIFSVFDSVSFVGLSVWEKSEFTHDASFLTHRYFVPTQNNYEVSDHMHT